MDLFALLAGLRSADAASRVRKRTALIAAHQAMAAAGDTASFEQFLSETPETVLSTQFGPPAEDAYLTGLLATIGRTEPGLDLVLAGALNHAALQLNNQRRFFYRGRPPEAFILDGERRYLATSLANCSMVMGFHIGASEISPPAWAAALDLPMPAERLGAATMDRLLVAMAEADRRDVGVLALLPPHGASSIDLAERYAALEPFVSSQTQYVIAGSAEFVLSASDALQRADPSAYIASRLYGVRLEGGGLQYRGIVIAQGFTGLPQASLQTGVGRVATASSARDQLAAGDDGVSIIDYARQPGETVELSRPFAVSSSAALGPTMRQRISNPEYCPYNAAFLRNATLVPTANGGAAYTIDRSGNLINDFGLALDAGGEFYSEALTAEREKLSYHFTANEIVYIEGAAMPLAFTPLLHTFHSHFLQQCFPRVLILEDLSLKDAKLIVPATLRGYQREMLARVGFGNDRLVFVEQHQAVRADLLISPAIWPLVFTPYTNRIFDRLVHQTCTEDTKPYRRIFLSREANTYYRNMVNYTMVKTMLVERYGFEFVRPEQLSLEDEIRLFHDAEIVVGAEGAGMYNGCFGQRGSIYISIVNDDYTMPALGSLGAVRGLQIAYVVGEALFGDRDHALPFVGGHSDFIVDPQRVADVVEEAIARVEADRRGSA